MKLSCPACGAVYSLEMLLTHDSAREAVMAALALPAPLGKLLIQYIALFRPNQRQLSFDRVARLLEELKGPISEAKIERNGRIWPAPLETWKAAIGEMIAARDNQKLQLPLTSHGYLFAIIAGQADKAAAAIERKKEEQTRNKQEFFSAEKMLKESGLAAASTPSPNVGAASSREPAPQPVAPAPKERSRMPSSFKETVASLGIPLSRPENKDAQ
jgi:hypothetical protein